MREWLSWWSATLPGRGCGFESCLALFAGALKSVKYGFRGIFLCQRRLFAGFFMATMQNCYFSRKGVCDKIEKMTAQEQLSLGEKR